MNAEFWTALTLWAEARRWVSDSLFWGRGFAYPPMNFNDFQIAAIPVIKQQYRMQSCEDMQAIAAFMRTQTGQDELEGERLARIGRG